MKYAGAEYVKKALNVAAWAIVIAWAGSALFCLIRAVILAYSAFFK